MKIEIKEYKTYKPDEIKKDLADLGYHSNLDISLALFKVFNLKKDSSVVCGVINGSRTDNTVAQAILDIISNKIVSPIAS